MSYVVLARKWRPTQFDDVVGQGHVARTLKNAIEQDRVHHAFLFTGARGVGKTSTARILAKALNCAQGPTATPCGECSSCTEIASGQAVDVFEIDGASNRGINEIRELRESVRYAPSRDRYKIYIIDEVHMLTTEAFNALLKTLEEPPPHAKFIFATTEPQKIPVTILSRCQRYDFKRIGQTDIVAHLEKLCGEEGITSEREALQIIARQAAGGMRDALSILDQIISFSGTTVTAADVNTILGVANRRHLFELSDAVITHDTEAALLVLDEVNRYGYDLHQFAAELVNHFRDLMVVSVVREPEKVTQLTDSEISAARAQVETVDHTLLHRFFDVMATGAQDMTRSAYPKLIFEMTLVRLAQLEPLVGLDLLVDRLTTLEAEFDGDPPPPATRVNLEPGAPRDSRRLPDSVQPEVIEDEAEVLPEPPIPEPETLPSDDDLSIARDLEPEISAPEIEVVPIVETPQSEPTATRESAPLDVAPPQEPRESEAEQTDVKPLPLPGRLSTHEIETLPPSDIWKKVVDALRPRSSPVAATCEHAYVERIEDGVIELSFSDAYLDFMSDGGGHRLEEINTVVHAMFGDDWRVVVDSRTQESSVPMNLADEREEDRKLRRIELEKDLRQHPAVQAAQTLFDVDPDTVRVQVKLFDDP